MPGDPVRVGLAGCGEVTRAKHLPSLALTSAVKVAALCDSERERGERLAAVYGVRRVYSDYRELCACAELDAIGVCVPPGAHADVAVAALQAGKAVWIDKPLALSEADCRRIAEAAHAAGVPAMTGFHMRFHRLVRQARDIIRRGDLGPLQTVRATWHSPREDEGLPAWRRRRENGGGALVEIAVHHLDLVRFLLDDEIAEVYAQSRDGVRDDEAATISIRMRGGVLVTAEFSERSPHEIELTAGGSRAQLRVDCLRFDGLEKRTLADVPGAPRQRLRGVARFARGLPGGLALMAHGGDYRDSYRRAWVHFAHAVREGLTLESDIEDGRRAWEAVDGCLRSRQNGASVVLQAGPVAVGGVSVGPPGGLKFSIVVPTRNRPDLLPGLLDALVAQTFPRERFEVILVDDESAVPVREVAARYEPVLALRVVRQQRLGCGPARQRGVELARGEYLVFTDDDCRPVTGWLAHLAEAAAADPRCAVCGPTVNGLEDNPFAEATQTVVTVLSGWEQVEAGELDYCPTSNVAFPAREFHEVGGLRPDWALSGGEDRDLCARWRKVGLRIRFAPPAGVYHYHPLSGSRFVRQHFNYGRGAYLYHRTGKKLEHWSFYLRLVAAPFARRRWLRAAPVAGLVVLAQVATAAGLVYQAATHEPRP